MTRLIIDIDDRGESTFIVKEVVAMELEKYGKVRVVSVIRDGKEQT